MSKACASYMQLPLIKCEISKLFNKYVGETDANLRKMIQLAESMAPCVLQIDEIEKALSVGGGQEVHETTSRELLGLDQV